MATAPDHCYTFSEYLDLEARAAAKSEYCSGQILAMAGGTETHSRLSVRIGSLLDRYLNGCRIYDSNLLLYVEANDHSVYPDCMALCGDPKFWQDRRDVILNPTVVVEVLSPSTRGYDKGDKSLGYRTIPSIQEILLISQDGILVEHFIRTGDYAWTINQFNDRLMKLSVLGVEISMEEIFRGIL